MAELHNLARMTTATTGTGTITLGSAVTGFKTFAAAGVSDGEVISYAISDGSNSEAGTGTYTASGTTLTRTVTSSTNSDAAISLSGNAQVFITPRAEDIVSYDGVTLFLNAVTTSAAPLNIASPAGSEVPSSPNEGDVWKNNLGLYFREGAFDKQFLFNGANFTSNILTITDSIELGHASDTTISRVSAGVAAIEGNNIYTAGTDIAAADGGTIGRQSIYIPASSLVAATTSGPASGQVEETTNAHNYSTLDFDASSDEYACFEIAMPKGWDEGVVNFRVRWSSTATDTDGVSWALQGVAVGDGENSDVAYGTAVVVDDANQSGAGEHLVSAISGDVTIAGTPAEGDLIQFRIFRDVSDSNDTATEDAQLRGVEVFYNINSGTDD